MTIPPKKTSTKVGKIKTVSAGAQPKPTSAAAHKNASQNLNEADRISENRNSQSWAADKSAQLKTVISDRANKEAAKHKGTVADQIQSVSSALKTAGAADENPNWFSNVVSEASSVLDSTAESISSKDSKELFDTARSYAKNNPAIFLAGCAVAGFTMSRIFKAGGQGGA